MEWRRLVRELELTRKDRIGLLVLAALVGISLVLPVFFEKWFSPGDGVNSDTAWIAEMRAWLADTLDEAGKDPAQIRGFNRVSYSENRRELTPFPFDPNSLDEAGWLQLGLPQRTVKTILNYRQKGGRFRQKEDLSRIYGIRPEQYEVLEPYIRISDAERQQLFDPKPERSYRKTIAVVDINEADTAAFIALPGIGSKLASRIVAFREKLGGFYSIDQLKEVYGLADSVFQKIVPYLNLKDPSVRQININTATEEELKAHPYIRYVLAKPIVAYRAAHGRFEKVEDLKKVMAVTEEILSKVKPYLRVD